jgi:hypothetical protein
MNYKKLHNNIINKAHSLDRSKKNGYFEQHHIILKSMGGSNKKENLVLLTAKEHYVVHHLLWKIHKNTQTALAFLNMRCNNRHSKRTLININHKEYEKLRLISRANSVEQGRIAGLKAAASGRLSKYGKRNGKLVSKEAGINLAKTYSSITGKKTGVVNCRKLGLAAMGSKFINDGQINKRISKETEIPTGWVRGRVRNG